MVEDTSKGIALVILGIVAIIAIVGLVLLFTGAKKAAGEFAVVAPKEYGGAIQGVALPYAREFAAGKAYADDYGEYSSAGETGRSAYEGTQAMTASGDIHITYNRADVSTPVFVGNNCQILTEGKYPVEVAFQQFQAYQQMGRNCVTHVRGLVEMIGSTGYPKVPVFGEMSVAEANGNFACCAR